MKLIINKKQIADNPEVWLRRVGYGLIEDHRRGVTSFVRRLGNDFYPRLHLYFDVEGDKIIFSLHLDQKQASYEGSHMHNAEYDSEIVANEIERLKQIILGNL
jgi:hypothetical protein